jgi:hypothetical protein
MRIPSSAILLTATAAITMTGPLATPAVAQGVTWKLTTLDRENEITSHPLVWWMKTIGERTNKRVEIQPYWSQSLVSAPRTMSAVKSGIADVGYFVSNLLSTEEKDFAPFDIDGALPTDATYLQTWQKIEPVVAKILDRQYVADIQAAGSALNVRIAPVLIGGPSELEEAFSVLTKEGAQAVIVQGFFGPYSKQIAQLASSHRIGYMSSDRSAVVDGGLVSISANFPLLYEYAAVYVDKLLKGANPPSLPVEQPSKFQVTVNSKTAQALGLSLSPILLAQVDEVIE